MKKEQFSLNIKKATASLVTFLMLTLQSSYFVVTPTQAASTPSYPSNGKFLQLSMQDTFGCGLRDDSTVWCWDGYSEDDSDTHTSHMVPGLPPGIITEIFTTEAGSAYAVYDDGSLYGWGYNGEGYLGTGDTTNYWVDTATRIGGGLLVKKVASVYSIGDYRPQLYARTVDGEVYGWGFNSDTWSTSPGYLGVGPTAGIITLPTRLEGALVDKNIKAVFPRLNGGYAIDNNHTLYSWGSNDSGLLGVGNTNASYVSSVPVEVAGEVAGKKITTLNLDDSIKAYALSDDGKVYAWGYNIDGDLGINDPASSYIVAPVALWGGSGSALDGKTVRTLYSNYVITTDGEVYGWGYNYEGELGVNDTDHTKIITPTRLLGSIEGQPIREIVMGYNAGTYAITEGGMLHAWGRNFDVVPLIPEEGTGTITSPMELGPWMFSGQKIKKIAVHDIIRLALTESGEVYYWGQLSYYDPPVYYPTILQGLQDGLKVTDMLTNWSLYLGDGTEDFPHGYLAFLMEDGTVYTQATKDFPAGHPNPVFSGGEMQYYTPTLLSSIRGKGEFGNEESTRFVSIGTWEYPYWSHREYAALSDSGILYSWWYGADSFCQKKYTDSFYPKGSGDGYNTPNAMSLDPISKANFLIYPGGGMSSWGDNYEGELGHESHSTIWDPEEIPNFWQDIDAVMSNTDDQTFAIAEYRSSIFAWGNNTTNSLGINDPHGENKIVFPDNVDIKNVYSSNSGQNFALLDNGDLYGWGKNTNGWINPDPGAPSIITTPFLLTGSVRDFAARGSGMYLVRDDGTAYAWGNNANQILGVGSSANTVNTPTPVAGISGIQKIYATYTDQVFAIDSAGKFYAWGDNESGVLGVSNTSDIYVVTPTPITGSLETKSVKDMFFAPVEYSSDLQVFATTTDGEVHAWGKNLDWSQAEFPSLGTNNWSDGYVITPEKLKDAIPEVAPQMVSPGMILYTDGSLYIWGVNPTFSTADCAPPPSRLARVLGETPYDGEASPVLDLSLGIPPEDPQIEASPDWYMGPNTDDARLNILGNDSVGGVSATIDNVDVFLSDNTALPHTSIDPTTGELLIPPSSYDGEFVIQYTICVKGNPEVCMDTDVQISLYAPPVVIPDITANPDSGTILNTQTGTVNLLTNDTYSGSSNPSLEDVTPTLTGTITIPGAYIDPATGELIVPPTSQTGTHTLTYELCDNHNPDNCSSAPITITLNAPPVVIPDITANPDEGTFTNTHTGTVNLLTNDTYSGSSNPSLEDVTPTLTGTITIPGAYIDPATGELIVPPTSQTGTHTLTYELCDNHNPDNCSSAPITVTLNAPPVVIPDITANPDEGTFTNTHTGTIQLLPNDTYSGAVATPNTVTASLTGMNTIPGSYVDSALGQFIVPPTTLTGTHTLTYQICDNVFPNNCSSAPITITLNAPPVVIPPTGGSTWGTGGGGGGTVIIPPAPIELTTTPPAIPTKIYPTFTPMCVSIIKNLDDPRLVAYYDDIGVIDASNPDRRLTRAEFLKLVLNGAGVDVTQEADPVYKDVASIHTLKQYIAYATRHGIISGQGGFFRPNDRITRAEASKIFVNALGIGLPPVNKGVFADVPANNTLASYIEAAYDSCLFHGRHTIDGKPLPGQTRVFEPHDSITLGETVKVIYNSVHQNSVTE